MDFSEYQVITKMLDAAECLIRETLRRDVVQNNGLKTTLLDAQYHIGQAIDSLNEVRANEQRQLARNR